MQTEAESVIYKYPVALEDVATVSLPSSAKILRFGAQGTQLFLWALVKPSTPNSVRHFRIAGTGHPLGEWEGEFINTFEMMDGRLVFHAFEIFQ
jgi:hypothetical protein